MTIDLHRALAVNERNDDEKIPLLIYKHFFARAGFELFRNTSIPREGFSLGFKEPRVCVLNAQARQDEDQRKSPHHLTRKR